MRFYFFFPLLCWRKSQTCVEGKFTGGSNPLLYIPIHRAASSNIVLSPSSDVVETSAAACQTSLVGVFFFFFRFALCQPEGCTDQHFTQALHFHWTKTNPQNCTCQLFRSKRRTTLIFFFFGCLAISQINSKCIIYFNIKKTAIIPSSLVRPLPRREEAACFVFFFLGAVLWIVRAVILSLFCRAYVG